MMLKFHKDETSHLVPARTMYFHPSRSGIWADGNFAAHDTIEAALAEIPYFEESAKVWENDPCNDGEYARFDADKTIDWDFGLNAPEMNVSNEKLEAWKAGEIMLYAMHARAYVGSISDLTADDVKDFGNS